MYIRVNICIYIIHYVVTTIVVIPITSPFCLLIHYFQLCIFYRIPQKTYIYISIYICTSSSAKKNTSRRFIFRVQSPAIYPTNVQHPHVCAYSVFSCVFLSAGVKVTCFPYLSIQSVLV